MRQALFLYARPEGLPVTDYTAACGTAAGYTGQRRDTVDLLIPSSCAMSVTLFGPG